ncbi:P-loop containing nucleoside triphosphate hydrolase protein [Aspergillus cavernicola]|uniref:P-loop containing nucleoside triphosphate hydrolase protein n=1 Tax=Aspergillus cavernicola TaxID=176166 RepID=A0ABR4HZP9_9EURO
MSFLLMTYGTGAVGYDAWILKFEASDKNLIMAVYHRLNLTAANRIHILEPKWNPSVEEQAIGRAVRLGQAREVAVVKYVTEHTVEENILTIQKNKRHLANLILADRSTDSLAGRTEELKWILSITR